MGAIKPLDAFGDERPTGADRAYYEMGRRDGGLGLPYRPPIVGADAYKRGYDEARGAVP